MTLKSTSTVSVKSVLDCFTFRLSIRLECWSGLAARHVEELRTTRSSGVQRQARKKWTNRAEGFSRCLACQWACTSQIGLALLVAFL